MCTLSLLFAATMLADPDAYPNAKLLIEAELLAKPDEAKKFRVLDARPKPQYLDGHVPGSIWVDTAAWSKILTQGANGDRWPARLAAVGIDSTIPVVVYASDIRDATRVWTALKSASVQDVRLLNGGWTAWTDGKYPIEKRENTAEVKVESWKKTKPAVSTKSDILGILRDKSAQILDARTEGEFCGETETAKRAGTIPGAVRLEWSDLLDPKTKKFKPPGELKKMIVDRKIDLSKPAVTFCQSGGRASVLAFGLELMGGKDVRNYYRSWSEWGNAEETPIEKGKR